MIYTKVKERAYKRLPPKKIARKTPKDNAVPCTEPFVVVVLVHWRFYEKTLECLESLERQCYPNMGIIIVNNDSTPFLQDRIKNPREFKISVIDSGNNIGFSKACNKGLKKAMEMGGDYILVLNNDTIVHENFLPPLLNACEKHKNWIVGPLCYYYEQDKIENAGGRLIPFLAICRLSGIPNRGPPDYLSGACFLVRTKILKDVGLFKEKFIMYFEDTDWSYRAVSKGYKLRIIPESKIRHKHSSRKNHKYGWSNLKCYFMARNNFYFARERYSGLRRWLWFMSYLMFGSPLHLFLYCRNLSAAKYHLKGLRDGLFKSRDIGFPLE